MRRLFYLTLLVSVVLSACGTAAPPEATVPPAAATAQAAAPTQAPATAPAVVEAPTAGPTTAPVVKTEFTPTDPTTVNLALGRPQFVEFFAFW